MATDATILHTYELDSKDHQNDVDHPLADQLESRELSAFDRHLGLLEINGRVIHSIDMPKRTARYQKLSDPLPAKLEHLLPEEGLYAHQAEAIDLLRADQSIVLSTPTASGKSLCFQIPIAESVLRNGTALLIYPTKALAHDQFRSLAALNAPRLKPGTYDGDASTDERKWVRQNANVVLTNPEMLHYGLLPQHRKWANFLRRLDHVVIDELHVLRGVFGSHFAHVLRRLRRLCLTYGSDPTFVACSATIGDPGELATQLGGKPFVSITEDASPSRPRKLLFVASSHDDTTSGAKQNGQTIDLDQDFEDPPSSGAVVGAGSPTATAAALVASLVKSNKRTICFCSSRSQTERLALSVQQRLPANLRDSVMPYRSGYLAEERREIEDKLADGKLKAIITTSALELGVDIGDLDATIMCGFPGTVSSMWQQIGRSGRKPKGDYTDDDPSLAILIEGTDQLDQWFVQNPTQLFTRPPEPAVINSSNPFIELPQLRCAAYEQPLTWLDEEWWPELDTSIRQDVKGDELRLRADRRGLPQAVWNGHGVPFTKIGLRSSSNGQVRILRADGDLVGTVDLASAATQVHPGAIYLHQGQAWKVTELSLESREAVVAPTSTETWTQAMSNTDIDVIEVLESRRIGEANVSVGFVEVITQVTGYRARPRGRRESAAVNGSPRSKVIPLEMPPQRLETTAIWLEWPEGTLEKYGIAAFAAPGALHAAEHAAISLLPLFTICDRWDVGGLSTTAASGTDLPTIYIYDGYPGGIGISHIAFGSIGTLLSSCASLLASCRCRKGCPSCVQSPKCGNGNEPLNKPAALALLQNTIGETEPF